MSLVQTICQQMSQNGWQKLYFFIQTLYDSDNLFMMFNTFFHFIWKKVSDIIHSACTSSSPTDSYNLTKDQAEEMYLKVEGLATQRVIKSRWRFLRDQMHLIRSVKLKKHTTQKLTKQILWNQITLDSMKHSPRFILHYQIKLSHILRLIGLLQWYSGNGRNCRP